MERHEITTIYELAGEVSANDVYLSDFDYEVVQEVLDQIHDTNCEDIDEFDPDGLIDVYNADLLEWVSVGQNYLYVEDVMNQGLTDNFFYLLMYAQGRMYEQCANGVIDWLQNELEDIEMEREEMEEADPANPTRAIHDNEEDWWEEI